MTTPETVCLLLTNDVKWSQHLTRAVGGLVEIRTTAGRLDWTCEKGASYLRLLDLRHPEAEDALTDTAPELRTEVIAFGVPESEPFLACRDAGVFSVEPLDVPAERLRRTLRQAILLHQTQEELGLLKQRVASVRQPDVVPPADEHDLNLAPLSELWRASRHFHDLQKLLDQLVEGVASATRVSRTGIFARLRGESTYRLWAGLHCLDSAASLTFEPLDLFVRWLERHAHLVYRAHLGYVDDLRFRRLLQHMLDDAGAEVLVPLLGKRGLLGWLFIGHRANGLPFASHNLNDLVVIGEQVATLIENALAAEALAERRTRAEDLLDALPQGVVAVSEDGTVQWLNPAAERILGIAATEAVGRPVEQAGSRLADAALRILRNDAAHGATTWTDPADRRTIRVEAYRVRASAERRGALLLLSDVSRERLQRETQEEEDRHVLWNDLADAMSHEVRNPLVAIRTFAQLLPERYADAEFRQQFFGVVSGEVARLNAVITQINQFAHPPERVFGPIAPKEIAERAIALAAQTVGTERPVACEIEPELPMLNADAAALAGALACVLANAHEAVAAATAPRVALQVRKVGSAGGAALLFAVSDNGSGIPPEMKGKLFSPFGTSKPRGLGLGLPLARRTLVDHGGRIDIDSTDRGTTVSITLPVNCCKTASTTA